MASMAMTWSSTFLGSTTSLSKLPAVTGSNSSLRVMMVGVKASAPVIAGEAEKRWPNKRREVVLAAVGAAMWSIARVAVAEEEPKRGSPDAKKKYAPVCITNPTARICRN